MEYITDDSLLDIISQLRPQAHLNALACVASWLTERINRIRTAHSWKPHEGVLLPSIHFADIVQLTPFQDTCLNELFFNHQTAVPDADNAQIVANGLYQYLASDHYLAYVKTNAECAQTAHSLISTLDNAQIKIVDSPSNSQHCELDYTICISDYPLPVDECTPLWLFHTLSTPHVEKDFIESGDPNAPLHIPKERVLQIDGPPLQNGIDYINSNKNILYKDLTGYDTYICQSGANVMRIASLLMQFSSSPKKLLVYNHSFFFAHAGALTAKKRFQYCTSVHSMDLESTPFSIAVVPIFKGMNQAEYCLATCGFKRDKYQDYEKWIELVSGKTRLQLSQFPPFNIGLGSFWSHIDPQAEWKDPLQIVSTKALFYPLQAQKELASLRNLKRIIKTSLTAGRGKAGTESLTLNEVKDYCKKKSISATGSRKVLLERLLARVKEEIENV